MVKKIHYLNLKKRLLFYLKVCLLKIKNDLIKLLLNLNIVVSPEENNEKKKVTENSDLKKLEEMKNVPCGSGKKI